MTANNDINVSSPRPNTNSITVNFVPDSSTIVCRIVPANDVIVINTSKQ